MASLMRWDPFGDLLAVPREVDRFFDWTAPIRTMRTDVQAKMLVPTMDVLSRGDDMVVRIELPGIDPAAVDISVTDGTLAISGERSEEHESTEDDYLLRESSWGRFERRIALPKASTRPRCMLTSRTGARDRHPEGEGARGAKTHHIAIAAAPSTSSANRRGPAMPGPLLARQQGVERSATRPASCQRGSRERCLRRCRRL